MNVKLGDINDLQKDIRIWMVQTVDTTFSIGKHDQ